MITGKVYDWLRLLAQILLPAVGVIYFFVEGADTVLGMIMVAIFILDAFLWVAQRVYARRIGQGDLIIDENEAGPGLRLILDRTPEELMSMYEVRFEVKRNQDPTPV
jgi:hypothetical protein